MKAIVSMTINQSTWVPVCEGGNVCWPLKELHVVLKCSLSVQKKKRKKNSLLPILKLWSTWEAATVATSDFLTLESQEIKKKRKKSTGNLAVSYFLSLSLSPDSWFFSPSHGVSLLCLTVCLRSYNESFNPLLLSIVSLLPAWKSLFFVYISYFLHNNEEEWKAWEKHSVDNKWLLTLGGKHTKEKNVLHLKWVGNTYAQSCFCRAASHNSRFLSPPPQKKGHKKSQVFLWLCWEGKVQRFQSCSHASGTVYCRLRRKKKWGRENKTPILCINVSVVRTSFEWTQTKSQCILLILTLEKKLSMWHDIFMLYQTWHATPRYARHISQSLNDCFKKENKYKKKRINKWQTV